MIDGSGKGGILQFRILDTVPSDDNIQTISW